MFLGTSSMKPGLYRNVSSIFVKLSEKYNNNTLLLDCGEGTYQQLLNHFGEGKTKEILDKMKIIFLTHKHGDHMLGTLKVIYEIEKIKKDKQKISLDDDRIYIIAPKTVTKWIKKNIDLEPDFSLKDLFIFVDNREINPNLTSFYSQFAIKNNPYIGFSDVELQLSEDFLKNKINNYFEFINKSAEILHNKNINTNNLLINQSKQELIAMQIDKETCCDDNSNINNDLSKNNNLMSLEDTDYKIPKAIVDNPNNEYKTKEKAYIKQAEALKILEFYNYIRKNLGINFFSVEVFHCDESFGCFLEHLDFESGKRHWKISYSGDTRPCNNFHNYAAYSTLFIHEATFDDELIIDAKEKMHSTMEESIKLGKSCNSWRVALTHFSPRYIKLLPFKNYYMDEKAVFVNDYFSIKLSEFKNAYKTGKRLSKLLEAASDKQIF